MADSSLAMIPALLVHTTERYPNFRAERGLDTLANSSHTYANTLWMTTVYMVYSTIV